MKVRVLVTLDIDCDNLGYDPPRAVDLPRVLQAARQAVDNAINAAYGEGFDHDMADEISIDTYSVALADPIIATDSP